ncbi:MAG: EpsI family protein [Nitrospiraceae bacterium]|nr:EpsI family protein [Nitrospiraceae bacterium]
MMKGFVRFGIIAVVLMFSAVFVHLRHDIVVPTNKPFAIFPGKHLDWSLTSEDTFNERVLEVLKPTDYLSRSYTKPDGTRVHLYIGYHSGGKGSGVIHSPKHCMPGGGWFEVSSEAKSIGLAAGNVNIVNTIYKKGEEKEMFLYWYQLKGRVITNDYLLKIYEVVNSMIYNRRESAFIRVSVSFKGEPDAAYKAGSEFIKDFYPLIREFLPQ